MQDRRTQGRIPIDRALPRRPSGGTQRPGTDFSDLRALVVNCTLKATPEPSNTDRLAQNATAIMRANGVTVDELRAVDHVVPPGVQTTS